MKSILPTTFLSIIAILICSTSGISQTVPPLQQRLERLRQQREQQAAPKQKAAPATSAAPSIEESTKAVLATITDNTCKDIQAKPFPSEMHYYHSFHPTDTIFDFWCKLQTIKGNGKAQIQLTMNTVEHSEPLGAFEITSDGIPHAPKSDLVGPFISQTTDYAQSRNGVYFRRAVKTLKDVGVPADTPGADYSFFTGEFVMRLDSIEIMGTQFTVTGIFSPNLGLMLPKLEGKPVSYPEFPATGASGKVVMVGFPFSLRGVQLMSKDAKIKDATPEIMKMVLAKYSNFIKSKRTPEADHPNIYKTLLSDGKMDLSIYDGFATDYPQYLQMYYAPTSKDSPNSIVGQGEKAFNAALAKVKLDAQKATADKLKAKKDQNTVF